MSAGTREIGPRGAPRWGRSQLRDRLASGALSAEQAVGACLERVAAREEAVRGPGPGSTPSTRSRRRARSTCSAGSGRPVGSLHGLPDRGEGHHRHAPRADRERHGARRRAGAARERRGSSTRLEAEGAVVLGKTVTAELAYLHPGQDAQPREPRRTRPAARRPARPRPSPTGWCRSRSAPRRVARSSARPPSAARSGSSRRSGRSRARASCRSRRASTRSACSAVDVEGAALLADALFGHDRRDRASAPRPFPRLLETALEPSRRSSRPSRSSCGRRSGRAPTRTRSPPSPSSPSFSASARIRGGAARRASGRRPPCASASISPRWPRTSTPGTRAARTSLSETMRAALERGRRMSAHDYLAALDWPGVLNAGLDALFERCDAILTPAAPGNRPRGARRHGGRDLQRPVDALRAARDHAAEARGLQRSADGRAARRPARRGRASPAHGALARSCARRGLSRVSARDPVPSVPLPPASARSGRRPPPRTRR